MKNRNNYPLKAFLALFLLLAGFVPSMAQVTVQIGTGTATSGSNPISTNIAYNYTQQVYTATDIVAAGGQAGPIAKLRFNIIMPATPANSNNWTVYLGHSNRTQFTSVTDWEPLANLTQVFSGNITYGTSWIEVAFNTPFFWNGTSNLVVAVDENSPGVGTSHTWQATTTGSENRSIYYRNASTNPDPASPPSATGRVTSAPNIQFEFAPLCSGQPTPGNAIAAAAAVCYGGGTTLSLQNNYLTNSGIAYQWQKFDGTNWTNITSANSPTYTLTNATSTDDFRARLSCGADTGYSGVVTIVVNPLPVLAITPATSVVCPSTIVSLTASGADTYVWSPSTGLSATTGTSVDATVTGTRIYTVTGTITSTGCIATGTAMVNTINLHSIAINRTPALACVSGTPVTLGVSNNPTNATLEYQWFDSLGAVAQAWSTSPSYTFTPATDGVYKYSVKARLASCPTNETYAHYTSFHVGFDGDVTVADKYCGQTGGTITVTNPFGPGINGEVWYQNNFNTPMLYGGELFEADASITGNRLRLTPNTGGAKGGFMVYNTNSINPKTLSVEFDIALSGTTSTTNGADGLSWSFGPDVVGFPTGTANGAGTTNAEHGSGSGIKLGFDAYGTTSPNRAGVYLMYNCTLIDLDANTPGVLGFNSNNLGWWKNTSTTPRRISIQITETGLLTVKSNNDIIFNNVQLPAAYLAADKSTWNHAFAARTGQVTQIHEIDNLSIKYSSADYAIATTGSTPTAWQSSGVFSNVPVGTYDVFIANSSDHNCFKVLGTHTIVDASTPVPGNTIASAVNICANSTTPVTLSLENNYAAYTGITYQWQIFDGAAWANIQGATAATYTFTGLPETSDFRAVVACDTNLTGNSNLATIIAVEPPPVAVSPIGVTLCTGEIPTFTATGADSYTWAGTGLSATTGSSVSATVTNYQQYTVTGTDANTGCINTVTTYAAPIQNLPLTAASVPATVCASGSAVTLKSTTIPAYAAGGGTWEFQWLDSNNTVIQNWSADSTYTFTPTVDGYYSFNLQMRSTACDSVPQPVTIGFYVGFGGDVNVIDINCHIPEGTITLDNVFGPGIENEVWYQNDFNTPALYGGQLFEANASITGNRLRLTPNVVDAKGGFMVYNTNSINPASLSVEFDIALSGTATTTNAGGADGLSWSFGPDVVGFPAGTGNGPATTNAEHGSGSGIKVSFDAYGTGWPNRYGIYLMYNCTLVDLQQTSPGVLDYNSNNLAWWKNTAGTPRRISVQISETGLLTMKSNNDVIFSEVQLPAEYLAADKSAWNHAFAARTGNIAQSHEIDNLSIKYSSAEYGIVPTGSGSPIAWQHGKIFTGLTAGDYDVFIANSSDHICSKNLGTYSVLDLNPVVNFPNDTVLCTGQTLVLDAGNPGSYYEWNTGEVGTDEQLYTVSTQGTYIVNVTDTFNCGAMGLINVTMGANPVVNLGADVSICNGATVTLDAGSDGTTYLWSDNSQNPTLDVTAGGNYSVTVTNDDGCSGSDNINVTVLSAPSLSGLGTQVSGISVAFTAQTPQNASTYTWSFGDGNTITTTTPTINYNYAICGTYNITVTAENTANCGTDAKTATVTLVCAGIEEMDANGGLSVYPNPATDFIAIANPNGLTIDKLTVFDASGKQIFKSTNASNLVPDITTWNSGIYLVKIDAEGKSFVQRIIIGR